MDIEKKYGKRAYDVATENVRVLLASRALECILEREELPEDILKWVGTFVAD